VTAIASSGNQNCALTSLGGVKCWGRNDHGQLGDGTKTDRAAPVEVVGLPGPGVAIATGAFHTCAVLPSGGVDCWGSNGAGQLGHGTNVDDVHPVAVKGFGAATATVAIVSRSIQVTRSRVAAVRLRCGSAARCHGSLTVAAGSVRLGGRAFSTPAAGRGTVRVTLTARGFVRLVRARRLAARVSVTGAVAAARTVTLVAPS
jgi:Regulator of chromosome condensation (RCC1) repeat